MYNKRKIKGFEKNNTIFPCYVILNNTKDGFIGVKIINYY